MSKLELRKQYESAFMPYRRKDPEDSWNERNTNGLWKTHHSLQLTRFGLYILKRYTKDYNIPLLRIELINGRSISDLLMIANTMNVPYFLIENHLSNKVIIHTIDSDRSAMLIMNSGNVPHWANMYRED